VKTDAVREPGHLPSGEPTLPALARALGMVVLTLRQHLRLAWLRTRARARRPVASADPYRSLAPLPRFELRVGEDVLESESFGGIIAQMRALGCSDAEVIEAAIVTHRTPRGGKVQRRVNHMQRVDDALSLLVAPAHEGAFARRLRERDSLSGPSPRTYLD